MIVSVINLIRRFMALYLNIYIFVIVGIVVGAQITEHLQNGVCRCTNNNNSNRILNLILHQRSFPMDLSIRKILIQNKPTCTQIFLQLIIIIKSTPIPWDCEIHNCIPKHDSLTTNSSQQNIQRTVQTVPEPKRFESKSSGQ